MMSHTAIRPHVSMAFLDRISQKDKHQEPRPGQHSIDISESTEQ